MQDFFNAIMCAFKEVLKSSTMKIAMVSGMGITLIWMILGYLFWNDLVLFTSSLLSALPFSMLQSDGAWMLSTFLWLQLVIVTFAIVFTVVGNMAIDKVNKKNYAIFSISIGLLSAVGWSVVWFLKGDYIYNQSLKLIALLPFETVEAGISYLIGFYLIYTLIIVSLIFVTSMFSTKVLSYVAKEYFPDTVMYDETKAKSMRLTLRDTAFFLVASILSFPLLFIPVLNFIILVGLWIWLMKDTLANDTAAFVFGENAKEELKEHKFALWGISFIGSLFNFIPLFNVFGPYFSELSMLFYLKEKRDAQK